MPAPTTLIRNGLLFDGRGGEGIRADVEVHEGRVRRIAPSISPSPGTEVIEAEGRWVTPGFIDLHTHYDAEVELLPALPESVRHGVTSVVLGSCSLSLSVGDPVNLADMFCRVEAIPRTVVLPLLQKKSWDGPRDYFDHLDSLPLGPNVASFMGHSTMRMAAMGIGRSLSKKVRPSPEELARMDRLLAEALDAGYLGMSVQTLPWDKMDGEEFRSRPLPSVFARWSEYRHFNRTLRERERILQAVPNVTTKVNVFLFLLESAGLFRRKPLKTTAISIFDLKVDRAVAHVVPKVTRFFNRLLKADFRFQVLPEVFDLWADGIDLVVFEEFGAGTAALHLQEATRRAELLRDPEYRRWFKKQWRSRLSPKVFHRQLRDCKVLSCPGDRALEGKTFREIATERGEDEVETFLELVATHGPSMRWYTVMANDRPWMLERIVSLPDVLIGFSDAGAHLRNMAHYNFPLRMLRLVKDAADAGRPFMTIGRAVERLTSEIAEWLGMDAGTLAEGGRADLVVVDPKGLTGDLEQAYEEEYPHFGMKRLVRRDRAVDLVMINGRVAFRAGEFDPHFGKERGFGRVLRRGSPPGQSRSATSPPPSSPVAAGPGRTG